MVSSIDVCIGCQLTDGTDWARLELSIVTDGRVSPVVFKPGEKNDVNFFATEVIIYCDVPSCVLWCRPYILFSKQAIT